ncbi:MAG: hypothetical protein LBG11_02630 [Bifidobacteriaceae bacterium]|nr:hypothetical protein [Bifidobacteriaceae bacterium]
MEDWPADKPVQFDLSRQVIRLPPAPIRYDGAFWRFDYGGLFIPRQLAGPVLGSPAELWVLVDQGGLAIQEKLNAAVRPHGLVAVPEEMVYYNDEVMLLTGFWALITLAMAVASLNLAITAVDGAKERRPVVARQIALGVPGQVLRRAQTLQVAVPLTGAVGLGVIGGAAALVSYSLPDLRSGYIDFPWPQLGFALGTVVIGSALVLGLAAASTRLRLTPEDLRRE